MNGRALRSRITGWALAALTAIVVLGPLAAAAAAAFSSPVDFAQQEVRYLSLDNFASLFARPETLLYPIITTLTVTLIVTAIQTATSILACYAFCFFQFRGRRLLLAIYLVGYLAPPVVTVIPLSVMFARAGLIGTFWALVIPFALASPYAVLLLRQAFLAIPIDLMDAAALDGAGAGRTLRLVVLPIAKPTVLTVALVAGVSTWNAFLWPRLAAGIQLPQVQVAIASLQTEHSSNWTLVMAASLIALAPPLVATVIFQRSILRTINVKESAL